MYNMQIEFNNLYDSYHSANSFNIIETSLMHYNHHVIN